jgi:alginate O-acetyltransferase complex protein AlgI
VFLILAIVACTPLVKRMGERMVELCRGREILTVVYQVFLMVVPIVLVFLSTATLVGDSYNPFLYFRF